ncbi:hypothetical protein GCM10009682_20700 [Luedemannella flava]|uniref:Uncharacterized protein n=1 Tax=Luedemannella flava TaxID=349316 RepID=A0ABN2LTP9_9ACTN
MFAWNALFLVALYVWCGVSIATMSASAGMGEVVPYFLFVFGTLVIGLCLAVAVVVVTLALRPPARVRSVVGLGTGAAFGTYVFLAGLVGTLWSVGGLLSDTGVTDATWVTYLVVSLVAGVTTVVLTVRTVRRRA